MAAVAAGAADGAGSSGSVGYESGSSGGADTSCWAAVHEARPESSCVAGGSLKLGAGAAGANAGSSGTDGAEGSAEPALSRTRNPELSPHPASAVEAGAAAPTAAP